MPDQSPAPQQPQNDAAPNVEGPIGGAAIGIGWALAKLAQSLTGDGGIRLTALAGIAAFTSVACIKIDRDSAKEAQMQALLLRTGEDRVEREKSESGRRDKEQRDWMASEMDKQRTSFSANVSFITKAFADESEKNRAMVFKLAGARVPDGGEQFPAVAIPKITDK